MSSINFYLAKLTHNLLIDENIFMLEPVLIKEFKKAIIDINNNWEIYETNFKENIKFVYGQPIKKMVTFAKKKVYDTVIIQGVNGISNELKDTLRLGKVQTVIYMNSSTSMLAKDLQELSKYYKVEEIKAVDSHMYQSYVTSIAKLTRK